jgi:hypothetical protein
VQLWADNVYMAPTFIAYYGALQCGHMGDALLQTAYKQVKLYRNALFDRRVGLWRHIALGSGTDPNHWATGNAWAAAGALRVLATIKRSCAAHSMKPQQHHLEQWVREILDGAWRHQVCDLFDRPMLVFSPTRPAEKERRIAELHRRVGLVFRRLLNCTPGCDHVPLCVDHWK